MLKALDPIKSRETEISSENIPLLFKINEKYKYLNTFINPLFSNSKIIYSKFLTTIIIKSH